MNENLETIQPGEIEITQEIVHAIVEGQKAKYKTGATARRALHAKSHGTVKATFRIFDNLPQECKVGLFATPATYEALVRFSNGAFGLAPDFLPNVRGAAIKLLNVPGETLLPEQENSQQFDILMANHPTFFIPKLEQGALFMQGKMKELAKTAPGVIWKLLVSIFKLVKNPLNIGYSSQVAYLCGDQAVKYHLQPAKSAPLLQMPNPFDADYLRHHIEKTLRHEDAKFTFFVQPQSSPADSVEDGTILWRGPSIPIGELTILRTQNAVLESDGEGLEFDPWRVLKEHRPLGWAGRVRLAAYPADYKWRTETNASS